MLGLPKSTEFNKRIPKQKFYENMTISSTLKKVFVEQVKTIYWANKIAPSTISLQEGNAVSEIEVFEIKLNSKGIDEQLLRQIDKVIPYHILYLLDFQDEYQVWICYKEITNKSNKINNYYHTDWLNLENLNLKLDGLNMDTVYENLVRQIAGDTLNQNNQESLRDSIDRSENIKQLEKQIETLQVKIRKEKQLNRQIEMNAELKKLKKRLENF